MAKKAKKSKNVGMKKKSRLRTFAGVRHDLDDFFKMTDALTSEHRSHYPFVVLTPDGRVVIEKKGSGLATMYPPESDVLCQWPGKWRSDFFHFTVKEFQARWEARLEEAAARRTLIAKGLERGGQNGH